MSSEKIVQKLQKNEVVLLDGARGPNCKSGDWIWSLVPGAVPFL